MTLLTDNPLDPTPPGSPRPRARADLEALPGERLEAVVIDLVARMAAGTYELLVLVGELDHRGTWATWGALSCAAWLAGRCDVEVSTARTQVRVARAMIDHPELDAAMARGDLSYAKARVLVPHLTTDNATALVDLAEHNPAGRLGAAIAAWSQRNEDPDTITAHQRADALTALVTGGGATIHAEVLVHVTEDGNHLPDGTPLSDHAVTTLLPDAFVSLLLDDTARQPIDASPRRRTPTRRQRRVIDARQDHCQHPGCTATAFLQYDHIQPYATRGPTTIDNLQRLCGPHNRGRGFGGLPTKPL